MSSTPADSPAVPVETAGTAGTGFCVVLPVKPPALGKSRLGLTDDARRALAAAFALDTVAACLAATRVEAVLVATDDVGFAAELAAIGCPAIPDGVAGDLNGTLRQAAAEAGRRWPHLRAVALCADLPALRPADLDAALGEVDRITAGDQPAYVADASGAGTTAYAAPPALFDPHFGLGSADAHEDSGAIAVRGELVSLRHDVDDLDDLRAALVLGVGPRTNALAPALGLPGPA